MVAIVGDGGPLTNAVEGEGSSSATYTLPLTGRLMVESVYAEIDASAGASTPELIVRDKSGAVIAKKRQTAELAAGSPGSATWSLRLADEAQSGSPAIPFDFSMIWGATAGFYSFPSNDDGVKPGVTIPLDPAAFEAEATLTATYLALAGGTIRCSVYNPDTVAHQAFLSWVSIQQAGSNNRQFAGTPNPVTLPPGVITLLPFGMANVPQHLVNTSVTPPTWIAGAVYTIAATVIVRV